MRLLLGRLPPRCAQISPRRPPPPLLYPRPGCRLQSSHATTHADPQPPSPPPPEHQRPPAGLFAVEHVHGRARYLSWSESGGIQKEWRELGAETPDSKAVAVSTKSSPLGRLTAWLRQMFLPTNYPQSVHPSYMRFHVLQFLECIFGTVVGVLCNQALLVSVGVSAEGSILGAVAVQWVIKDGAGEVAKLWFIRRFSPYFDSHPKTFTFTGASLGLVGSALQIASLIVPANTTNFLLCAAGGNVFKCVGGAVWLTTHIKFVRFFARQGNMGDVAAKSESQGSVGVLLGYAVGVGLLTISHSAPYLYSIFALAVPLHLGLTSLMLRTATFELLTLPRLSFLAREFLASAGLPVAERRLSSLHDLERENQTGSFGEFFKRKQDKYVQIAPTLEEIIRSTDARVRAKWDICVRAFDGQPYLLYPYLDKTGQCKIAAFYHPSATVDDRIRSVLHAAYLERHLSGIIHIDSPDTAQEIMDNPEVLEGAVEQSNRWIVLYHLEFRTMLHEKGWRIDEIAFAETGRRVLWGKAAASEAPHAAA